jgi:hypothetical protein
LPGGSPGWPPEQPAFGADWDTDPDASVDRLTRHPGRAVAAGLVALVVIVAVVLVALVL